MQEFWLFLSSFKEVTTAISLAAFCVAAITLYLRGRHIERLSAIKKAEGEDALQLVNGTLVAFDLNTAELTREQRFQLAQKELDRLSKRQLFVAILVGLIASLLAALTIVASLNPSLSEQLAEEFDELSRSQILKDLRTGTPASRDAALRDVQAMSVVDQEEVRLQIASGILAGQGKELCNLMLAAKSLDEDGNITKLLKVASTEAQYQLAEPVCSSEVRPDFSNSTLQKVGLEKPNIFGAKFLSSEWHEVVFIDTPDYSGRESVDCRIADSNFNGLIARNSSFTGCVLSQVTFNSSNLENVNFNKTVLNRVDFRSSSISNMRFIGSTIRLADFRGVNTDADILFVLSTDIEQMRIDIDLAKGIEIWPEENKAFQCVSEVEASECWDMVSEDIAECRSLTRPKVYVVARQQQLESCKSWAEKTFGAKSN